MSRIILPFLVIVVAVVAMTVLDIKKQSTPAPIWAPRIPMPQPEMDFAVLGTWYIRRVYGVRGGLPRRAPGAALDPKLGGEPAPVHERARVVGVVEMPPGDPHRIVVDRATLYAHLSRPIRVDERRRLRIDWRDVVLIGVAA